MAKSVIICCTVLIVLSYTIEVAVGLYNMLYVHNIRQKGRMSSIKKLH